MEGRENSCIEGGLFDIGDGDLVQRPDVSLKHVRNRQSAYTVDLQTYAAEVDDPWFQLFSGVRARGKRTTVEGLRGKQDDCPSLKFRCSVSRVSHTQQ